MNQSPFGEIIESSLTQWKGQTWHWDYFPPLGSLVIIHAQEMQLLALIHDSKTGSSDPGREPYAYQKTQQELRQQQPQIFSFLKTTFSCVPMGFIKNDYLWYQIPPIPPTIHSFVEHASTDILVRYFSDIRYLELLWQTSTIQTGVDELFLAIFHQLHAHNALTTTIIEHFMERFSMMSGNDYRRVKLFAYRAQGILTVAQK